MMGARDGRGGPGATEIGAAGNLGRAAAAAGAEFENRPGGNGGLRARRSRQATSNKIDVVGRRRLLRHGNGRKRS